MTHASRSAPVIDPKLTPEYQELKRNYDSMRSFLIASKNVIDAVFQRVLSQDDLAAAALILLSALMGGYTK